MFYMGILLILLSFLSGSIMYSYLLPKILYNVDIVKISDDHNPGSANVIKHFGIFTGAICIILDLLKAFVPVYISITKFNVSGMLLVFISIAPILGHAFSPFLHFKGGKAIASTFGSFLALYHISNIALTFAFILVFFKFIITIKPNSSVILVSVVFLTLITFTYQNDIYIKLIALLTSLILGYKHKINRNEGAITISLFNRYFKKTLYNFNENE